MRYIISEKQLASLIVKKGEVDEQEAASSEPSISTAGSSSSSSGGEVSSMGADEYPAYPEVSKWDPKITRGHANPLGNTKWTTGIERGTGNPISPNSV